MFCGKCGANNPDGASFCKECGAPLAAPETPAGAKATFGGAAVKAAPTDSKRYKKIGIAAVVVAVVLVFTLLSSLSGGGAKSAEDAALRYTNAIFKPDAKAVFNLFHKDIKKATKSKELNEAIRQTDSELERQLKQLDNYLGEGWKYSCNVTEINDVSEWEMEWIQQRYETKYKIKVTEAQKVRVAITITAGNNKDTEKVTVPVIKVGSSWYLDPENMSSFGF